MKSFLKYVVVSAFAGAWLSCSTLAQTANIEKVAGAEILHPLPMSVGGRTIIEEAGGGRSNHKYQWPGTYFEAAFDGKEIYCQIGQSDEILHVIVDDQPAINLVKPSQETYRIGGLSEGRHVVRVEVVTESQRAPNSFGGFALSTGAKALSTTRRSRQIEFIGDSHTVGYGNTSRTRNCSPDEVWSTTDNSQAFGALTAKHYNADYQINAISGRGIIRNYNGGPGDPLPSVYPYGLFDKKVVVDDKTWRPQIVVIGLGNNDFSTPLNPAERWKSRDELQADFEANYVKFVQTIRAKDAGAFFILIMTAGTDEMQAEVRKVVDQLRAAGESKITFIPINGLSMTGCDWHPSSADDKLISDELVRFIDAEPRLWQGK